MVKRIFRSLLTYCVIIIFITVSLLIAFLHIRLNLFDKGDIPDMLIVFAVALVLSLAFAVVFSRIIAKNIVAPLDGLRNHLENPEEYKTYPELQPFVDELARQKKKQRRLSRQKKTVHGEYVARA